MDQILNKNLICYKNSLLKEVDHSQIGRVVARVPEGRGRYYIIGSPKDHQREIDVIDSRG